MSCVVGVGKVCGLDNEVVIAGRDEDDCHGGGEGAGK